MPRPTTSSGPFVIGTSRAAPMLISSDDRLHDHVRVAAAAARVEALPTRDAEDIRASWRSAAMIFVGIDMAAVVAGMGLPDRPGVHLIGGEATELVGWSVPLGASTLVLPDQSGMLVQLLADAPQIGASAPLVSVWSGTGGVGASTLAAALAQRAMNQGLRTALVENDPDGAGIDLLFGAESETGWRWPDLTTARGHIGDLHGQLPNVSGVDLVSCGRTPDCGNPSPSTPSAESLKAVVDSLRTSHELVVIDQACGAPHMVPGGVNVVVVGADARGTLAARVRVHRLSLTRAEVVVRTGSGRRLNPDQVAHTVGPPLLGVIRHQSSLPLAQEVGDPPGRARNRYARQVDVLVGALRDRWDGR